MKRNSSSLTARTILNALFLTSIVGLFCAIPLTSAKAQNPASGSVGPSPGGPSATWQGTASAPGGGVNTEANCVDGVNCEVFTLTVNSTPAGWAGQKVRVQLTWSSNTNEYDIYIHQGTLTGPLVTSAMNGPGLTFQTAYIDPAIWGTGTFVVHVVYDTTPTAATDHYTGVASGVPLTPAAPPPAPQDTGPQIGYENFEAPGVLTPVTVTTGPTVEYMGRGAGEPSIGVDWNSPAPNDVTGVTNFQSDLETLFITFTNACSTGGPTASWVNRRAPTSVVIDSDPIGFTDRQTGRVFAAELTATSPTCKISFSDDDGNTWVPSPGTLGSGIDHETIGGGPYHSPLVGTPAYPNAVYYCSQDLVAAFCLRSDDGGATWGPPVQTYVLQCGGLHGHVKVSPADGTVYVPNNSCGGDGAVVVSEDNGITWNIRPVKNASFETSSGNSDPAVAIDGSSCPMCAIPIQPSRLYFVMANADSSAAVATSDDNGNTWQNIFDVGAVYGLKNIRYPAAVAGDFGRAAVAFYGSTTAGDANSASFNGIWHLYVAHTFDGGLHWTTSDVTPSAPMQRGCIWTGGGANICRNLLDFFDMTIDKQGRVEVGYVNGCPGGNCAQAATTAIGNGYSATGTIARQSSGRRLLAAFDPPSPLTATSVPGMPTVTARRVGSLVRLAWSEADTGNLPITSYRILRGIVSTGETLRATVPGTQTTFNDFVPNIDNTYYYEVQAVNDVGMSCANNEVAAPFMGNTCSGMIIHQNLPSHPESAAVQNGANPELAIDYISVGEPPGTGNFIFTMKVSDLNPSSIPPNSRWRIVWDSFSSPGQQWYVGMTTDANSVATFEYGTITTAVVGLVVGIPTETMVGTPLSQSNFNADGTITIFIPKSAVGNPQPGDLLGAVNGRTFNTGDTPPETLERSTALIDHTFVKGQTDNAFPAATYTVAGNGFCNGGIGPMTAVSRKTHGSAGTFDVDLPLTGTTGIECRIGQGANSNNHKVIFTFAVPVAVNSVTVTPGSGGTASVASSFFAGNQITVNLTNVSNAQTLTINLNGLTDGGDFGNISWPMGVLLGDVNASRRVDAADVSLVRQQTLQTVTSSNFREDINATGRIDAADVSIARQQTLTSLP